MSQWQRPQPLSVASLWRTLDASALHRLVCRRSIVGHSGGIQMATLYRIVLVQSMEFVYTTTDQFDARERWKCVGWWCRSAAAAADRRRRRLQTAATRRLSSLTVCACVCMYVRVCALSV